ncbi:beta-ketoacyl synthase N-terminal-like domain-containing protein [Endozoicomonas lisbonensis]|uniref:3-oxoacyl-[acyl-carrier-protein] synthase II n=1 Tax=Endozoicomonas lisbonensis TaxID=3120522 RepID=A0ABV2SJD7_9GAMM
MKRVVVTGMSAATPIGNTWQTAHSNLRAGNSGIRYMDEWEDIQGLSSLLAAPVTEAIGQNLPRKQLRAMSRVSRIAAQTTSEALSMSGLNLLEYDQENVGIAYGSSFGSADQLVPFGRVLSERVVRGISPTGYIKLMGHTAAVNLSQFTGAKGRLIPTSTACASAGQAIGYAWETIRQGIHPVMIAGSSEELSPMQVAVFDSFYAASRDHDRPEAASRPFSKDRSGIVVGEGGATFILEDLEHAQARNAPILAEITGFATNMDGHHLIQQNPDRLRRVIEMSLQSAGLKANQIGYINANASGAESDYQEVDIIRSLFGSSTPVASSKGHIGQAFGGGGAMESWLTINMMNGWSFKQVDTTFLR